MNEQSYLNPACRGCGQKVDVSGNYTRVGTDLFHDGCYQAWRSLYRYVPISHTWERRRNKE